MATEGFRDLLPPDGYTVDAGPDWGYPLKRERRKVIVYKRKVAKAAVHRGSYSPPSFVEFVRGGFPGSSKRRESPESLAGDSAQRPGIPSRPKLPWHTSSSTPRKPSGGQ